MNKKISISRLIMRSLVSRAVSKGSGEGTVNAKITESLCGWVERRGYCRNCGMDEVAEELGVSREQLAFYFHSVVAEGFISWRTRHRIRYAMTLLEDFPSMPASLVGETVGIPDKSDFRKLFRKHTGLSPLEWRASRLERLGH